MTTFPNALFLHLSAFDVHLHEHVFEKRLSPESTAVQNVNGLLRKEAPDKCQM